jgi:hypothetical protein
MICCVVYLLRIFKMFHGLMNNPVYVYMKESIVAGVLLRELIGSLVLKEMKY